MDISFVVTDAEQFGQVAPLPGLCDIVHKLNNKCIFHERRVERVADEASGVPMGQDLPGVESAGVAGHP
jgi:hypothetical protein